MSELRFSGLLAKNGKPAFVASSVRNLLSFARGHEQNQAELEVALRSLRDATNQFLEVVDGVDPRRPEEAGWGALFPAEPKPGVREALQPLLDWRQRQVGAGDSERFQIYEGAERGYRMNEGFLSFLGSRGSSDGPVDPRRMPYYLLLVGEPTEIPFDFQYQLDMRHAVGRLSFPTVEEYAAYAENVVAAEKRQEKLSSQRGRRITFFCPVHEEDFVECLLLRDLVLPLTATLTEKQERGWTIETVVGADSTRERLLELLSAAGSSDLLFTACHGLVGEPDSPDLRDVQGALACAGYRGQSDIRRFCVGGSDLGRDFDVSGRITFHFGCFTGGSPIWDGYERSEDGSPRLFATEPFTSGLAGKLLGTLSKGALAVVGHVDRAWTYSFVGTRRESRLAPFEECLRRLLRGEPVGRALETFNLRYAALSAEWLRLLQQEQLEPWVKPQEEHLLDTFCAWLDARSFIVLGDPAVKITMPGGECND